MTFLRRKGANQTFMMGALFASILGVSPAFANGYGEDTSWQFQTSADMANLAAVQSLIQQKKGHMFQPASVDNVYNSTTTIQHQTNCSVTSTAVGNTGTNGIGGNSSTSQGATASSTGNLSTSTLTGQTATGLGGTLSNTPSNSGQIGSTAANDSSSSSASGNLNQALNSSQTNNAGQTSSQTGNTACLVSGSGTLN